MLTRKLTFAPAVLAALLSPSAHLYAKAVENSTLAGQARQSLFEMRDSAVVAENNADELRMIVTRPDAIPESVSTRLKVLKSEVNKMGAEIKNLQVEREALPGWEQRAIDKTLGYGCPLVR
jgi:hypothetical protein